MQARLLRQPGLPWSTKSIDDAWILPVVSVMKMVVHWRTATAKKLQHRLWDFCARECAGSTASRPPKRGVQECFGTATDALGPQQTKRTAEANLPSGKRVENSVHYGT